MPSSFLNRTYVKSGIPAEVGRPVLLGRFDLADEGNLFLFCAAVLAPAVAVVVTLGRRRPGRALLAVRDNEWAAEARGVSLARTRLAASAASGALAGVAGGLHVIALNGVKLGTYAPSLSFEAFSMVVVGGLTSVWGAILGAIALRYAQYFVRGANRDNWLDSRYWGSVPDRNIVGKAFLIWMNFGNLKRIGSFE